MFSSIILMSCAKTGELTGGKKDEIAPTLKIRIPENFTTNYQGNQIRLLFDEYVTLKSPETTIRLYPGSLTDLSFTSTRNEVILKNLSLKQNTTYVLHIQDGVQDINEKNVSDIPSIIFSTGPHIDTARIEGSIVDAQLKPIPNMRILVIRENDSVNKKNVLAEARTTIDGSYKVTGLKSGSFDIYFFEDLNNNLQYDMPKEYIALKKTIVVPSDTSTVFTDRIAFRVDERPLELLSVVNRRFRLEASFNKAISHIQTDAGYKIEHVEKAFNKLYIYPVSSDTSHQEFRLHVGDSAIFSLDTILSYDFIMTQPPIPKILNIQLRPAITDSQHITLLFDLPIDNTSIIKHTPLDASIEIPIRKSSSSLRQMVLSVRDSELTNDTTKLNVIVQHDTTLIVDTVVLLIKSIKEQYSIVNLLSHDTASIYYLSDKSGMKFHLNRYNSSLRSDYLIPGEYTLHAIIDSDHNAQYTNGSLLLAREPEIILTHKDVLKLKANWTVDINTFVPKTVYKER